MCITAIVQKEKEADKDYTVYRVVIKNFFDCNTFKYVFLYKRTPVLLDTVMEATKSYLFTSMNLKTDPIIIQGFHSYPHISHVLNDYAIYCDSLSVCLCQIPKGTLLLKAKDGNIPVFISKQIIHKKILTLEEINSIYDEEYRNGIRAYRAIFTPTL